MDLQSYIESPSEEIYINVQPQEFKKTCLALHKALHSPVMMLFAEDRRETDNVFILYCAFMAVKYQKWFFVTLNIGAEDPRFESLSKDIYSAGLFEREINEMFGIVPEGNPDLRRLRLHDEVWPEGNFPLRKDFKMNHRPAGEKKDYVFSKVEGEGIFEIPVGPVHAGIIGPGHFRFSVAGEPIINLGIRLGWTHRGVEKLFEGKSVLDAVKLAQCVCGDSAFSHSAAFCHAVEKICGIEVCQQALILRAIFSELERMYNHVNDIGGMAVDVGFSFPAMYASLIKESILQLNENLTKSRYLKNINTIGGVLTGFEEAKKTALLNFLKLTVEDLSRLKKILLSSVSFMDRVDSTGILRKKTAQDLGIAGLAARASGISTDLRKDFPGAYNLVKFNLKTEKNGDALSRLNIRFQEFEESVRLIRQFVQKLQTGKQNNTVQNINYKNSFALGYAEAWRGPVLYWVNIDETGIIKRCKIVDPSFHNWQGLSFAVIGDIVPDFPLCNKSFDLSYSGNDL